MGLVTQIPYVAGATVTASGQNTNEQAIVNEFNGNIENVNVKSNAGIVASKLNLSAIAQTTAMSAAIFKQAKGADVASAAGTITLGDDGNYFDITGTEAITSITAKTAGTKVTLQFDSTASLVDGSNLKLAGNFQGAADSTITLGSDGTNWFEISRSPSTYTPSVTNALSGSVIQTITTSSSTSTSLGTTALPFDTTVPQNDEGNAMSAMDTAITPNNASNKLIITANITLGFNSSGSVNCGLAMFQDATASSLKAVATYGDFAAAIVTMTLVYTMTAGTTSATTFKFRAGTHAGVAVYINGTGGGSAFWGAASVSSVVIQEIKA